MQRPAFEITMKFKKLLPLTLSLILTISGRALAASSPKEAYQIGKDDVLDISVWQSPDLTKVLPVGSDGAITYPILGSIPAAGLTPSALERTIAQKLAEGYVKDPKVTVAVKEYNSKKILVFGEVVKPGLYKLKGKIPLLELLFMVGGVKLEAKRMTVIRPLHSGSDVIPAALEPGSSNSSEPEESSPKPLEVDLLALLSRGDLSQNIFIMPGDTIYVSSGTGERFYVLGQVKKPGPYEWVQDITLLEAVKMAGGPTEKAALNRITVLKNSGGGKESVKVNVGEIMQGKKRDDVMIKSSDVVVVPESWI